MTSFRTWFFQPFRAIAFPADPLAPSFDRESKLRDIDAEALALFQTNRLVSKVISKSYLVVSVSQGSLEECFLLEMVLLFVKVSSCGGDVPPWQ